MPPKNEFGYDNLIAIGLTDPIGWSRPASTPTPDWIEPVQFSHVHQADWEQELGRRDTDTDTHLERHEAGTVGDAAVVAEPFRSSALATNL